MRFSLLLLLAFVGCRLDRPPVVGDSTAVAVDSSTVGAVDTMEWPAGYEGVEPAEVTAADTVAPASVSARAARRAIAAKTGLPFGMSGYKPTTLWCQSSGVINATNTTTDPQYVPAMLALADQCGIKYGVAFSRRLMTTNGVWNGPFSVTKAKRLIDDYAAAMPLSKYQDYARRGVLLYWYTLDDMGCPKCWGGTAISPQQTAEVTKYAKQKLGPTGAGIFLRVHPEWMLQNGANRSTWAMPDGKSSVDGVISQWYEVFATYRWPGGSHPTQRQWYDYQHAAQVKLGIPKQSYTITFGGCYNAASIGCSADKIKAMGMIANDYPGNCANVGWNWRSEFTKEPHLSALKSLAADAAARPNTNCLVGTVMADSVVAPDTSLVARFMRQPEITVFAASTRTKIETALRRVLAGGM